MQALEQANAAARASSAEISRLKQQLVITEAHATGFATQVDALLKQHPDTPLLKASSRKWQSQPGNKTVVRRIYEQAFDAAARKRGIENPETRRTN